MRRVAVLLLLYLGMSLIIPLQRGAQAAGAESLLVFGFLVLAAYTVGELATQLSLPKIAGYLITGVMFGPALLGIVTADVIERLAPVNQLAIALIAFLAGAELRWKELREHLRTLSIMLTSELALTFTLVVGTLIVLRDFVPFLSGLPLREAFALAAVFGVVAIVHSPAVVLALLTETRARGPVTRSILSIVLVADVVVVLAFSGALAVARIVVPSSAETASTISAGALAWELGGSVLVGIALGAAVALYLRFVERELMMFAIIVAFLGSEIARLVHVETLLMLLVAGFVTENTTRHGAEALLRAMERSAAPVFVVFFALAGASVNLDELASIWPLALAVVAARATGIFAGTRVGAKIARAPAEVGRYTWLGLVAQAGVAIGLATVLTEQYPERGAEMRTLLLSVIAINEMGGSILGRLALVRSGEAGKAEAGDEDDVGVPAPSSTAERAAAEA
jgi:Kef-type K+ transport system membrane component KefB